MQSRVGWGKCGRSRVAWIISDRSRVAWGICRRSRIVHKLVHKPNSFEQEQADRSKKEQMKQEPNHLDQRQKEQHNFELYHSDSKHKFLLKYFTFMLISSDLIFIDN